MLKKHVFIDYFKKVILLKKRHTQVFYLEEAFC